jgi:hypothetical protein
MKIELSDETVNFIKELVHRMDTQDNRATASPYYFTVQCIREIAVPEETTDEHKYFLPDHAESFTEDELKEFCKDCGFDFEKTLDKTIKYGVGEQIENLNFFLTEEGYKEHIRLNGHNYRHYKRFYSYVDYAFRNPEIESLFKALREVAKEINK